MSDDIQMIGADAASVRRDRAFTIQDATVRSDGDGRTVEAYCAAFNAPAEIHDQDGHYNEVHSPRSFDKTVADNGTRFGVFYNHARTIYGTPDGALSIPIAVPVEAPSPDEYGVLTVSRYLDDNPLADAVLSAIKQKAITAQSFSGRFIKSSKMRASDRTGLPTITRNETAMREYGPTPFPAFVQAKIMGTRSADAYLQDLIAMDRDERTDLFARMMALAAPLGAATEPGRELINVSSVASRAGDETKPEAQPSAPDSVTAEDVASAETQASTEDAATPLEPAVVSEATPATGAGEAEEPQSHSARQSDIARRARVARIIRKETGL